jgi:predicted hydrolase (HD superfamily)
MPRAEILSTQAMRTLRQLHAELAGNLIDNKSEARRIIKAMIQVEAVMKQLRRSAGRNLTGQCSERKISRTVLP